MIYTPPALSRQGFPADLIDRARSARIEDELARRGITLRGRGSERCGPCPQCGGDDRFSINTRKQVFNCRGCGARGGDAIALVRFLDGCGFREAVEALCGGEPQNSPAHHAGPAPANSLSPARPDRSDDRNQKRAGDIWRNGVDPRGTIVQAYLEYRKLDLPDEAAGTVVRFHPSCWFGKEHHPAMVCLVRNIATNEPQAIHRAALTPDGIAIRRNGKTFRMSLGPVSGGAIKLDPDEDVTMGLCVGEGVETCLAGRQMGLRPVWSAISRAGITSFPILPGIEGLHILRENDANLAGPKSVEDCASRWRATGLDVHIADPERGSDLNDELRGAAA
jgi:putative DNA primase/helicase